MHMFIAVILQALHRVLKLAVFIITAQLNIEVS